MAGEERRAGLILLGLEASKRGLPARRGPGPPNFCCCCCCWKAASIAGDGWPGGTEFMAAGSAGRD